LILENLVEELIGLVKDEHLDVARVVWRPFTVDGGDGDDGDERKLENASE
jgi:hypothetical protein